MNAPDPAQPHPVVPAAQNAPLPEPAPAPSVPIAPPPRTVAQSAPSPSAPSPSRLARPNPVVPGSGQGGGTTGVIPLDQSSGDRQAAPTGSLDAPAGNGDGQLAPSAQFEGGFNATNSVEDDRFLTPGADLGGKTGTTERLVTGRFNSGPDLARGFAPGGLGPREVAALKQGQLNRDAPPPPSADASSSIQPSPAEIGRDKFTAAPENPFKVGRARSRSRPSRSMSTPPPIPCARAR